MFQSLPAVPYFQPLPALTLLFIKGEEGKDLPNLDNQIWRAKREDTVCLDLYKATMDKGKVALTDSTKYHFGEQNLVLVSAAATSQSHLSYFHTFTSLDVKMFVQNCQVCPLFKSEWNTVPGKLQQTVVNQPS